MLATLLLAAVLIAPTATPAHDAPPAKQAEVALPDTPQGKCAAAWFEVVSRGSDDEVRAFESANRSAKRLAETPIDRRVAKIPGLRAEFGTVTMTRVVAVSPARIATEGESSVRGHLDVTFEFDADGKLDAVMIGSAGPGSQSAALEPERREKLIDAACAAVRDEYVYPDKGAAMADAVESARKSGAYKAIATERELVDQLTRDMRSITNDRHLAVRIAPVEPNDQGHGGMGPSEDEARAANWQFKSCSIEPGNIGVLRFDGFIPTEEAKQVADAALAFLARCDAIVFDIRFNGGGSPDMLNHIAGYFFDEPTLLNRMVDRDGTVIGEAYSDKDVPGTRFAKDMPVFLVTSSKTFSCAEEFAYDLQALKRATLVGETTGGGAHPVKPVRLDDRIAIKMPHIRACNPVTKTNWEGCGVKPEVEVPAEQALERAIALAREKAEARRALAKK